MKNIVVAGISGHSKVVIDIIEKQNQYKIVGLIDPIADIGREVFGYSVIGRDLELKKLKEMLDIYGYIIGIGDNWIRAKVHQTILHQNLGLVAINAIHPTATIAKGASLGCGNVIMAQTNIGCDSSIADFCIINHNGTLDHDSKMENFSSLGPGVTTGGNVSIGAFSAVLIGATIKHGITIGSHSVVGAASLVLKDIESNVVVYGVPTKKIRDREIGERYL